MSRRLWYFTFAGIAAIATGLSAWKMSRHLMNFANAEDLGGLQDLWVSAV
ncbi:MAG: hypothetical protein IT445_13220 [Phycisphaeraceae bacterium]|nr:hypothetical protein [Phycisphaeraceae bacterium]